MNVTSSFFSDPKVILALAALILSIFSLVWTLANQWEQNRRWDSLNRANIVLKEAKMFRWKELTKDEATKTNWGYDPLIYSLGESYNIFQIPYRLVARDSTTRERVARVNPVFTLQEMNDELGRIGYNGEVFITRLFRPIFILENTGKTDAIDLSIEILSKTANEEWHSAFKSNTLIKLAGSQSSLVSFDVEFPIQAQLPPALNFRVELSYKDIHDNLIKTEIKVKWTSNDNFWSYGE